MTSRALQNWSVHVCALSPECRRLLAGIGPAWRLELNTPWWHYGVALAPGDRYGVLNGDQIDAHWTHFHLRTERARP